MSQVTQRDCVGCKDDFYNGKNPYGIKECWSLKSATMVKGKMLSIDQEWPERWLQTATVEQHPSCYQRQRYIFVKQPTPPASR